MKSKIQGLLGFNILKLKPINFVKDCTVPCIFVIGKNDKLVLPKRIDEVYKAYAGKEKYKITSEGDHSDERETKILN